MNERSCLLPETNIANYYMDRGSSAAIELSILIIKECIRKMEYVLKLHPLYNEQKVDIIAGMKELDSIIKLIDENINSQTPVSPVKDLEHYLLQADDIFRKCNISILYTRLSTPENYG